MKACFYKRNPVCVLLLLTLIFVFSGCRAEEKDHLAYQEYPIKAECVLSVKGEEYPFILDMTGPENARLTFTGSRLEGGVFGISGGDVFFINRECTFPLAASDDSAIRALLSAFSLSSSEMTEVTETESGLLVSYKHENADITVALEGEVPVSMELVTDAGDFTLAINEFTSGG